MKKDTPNISKALLDLAGVDDAVLFTTAKGQAALKAGKLDGAQRVLLERIDGFRSVEQVLAMSGDLTSVHGVLGKLMASGHVNSISPVEDDEPAPVPEAVEAAPPPPEPPPPVKATAAPAAKVPAAKAPPAANAPAQPQPAAVAKAPAAPAPAQAQKPAAPATAVEPELNELGNAKELLQREALHFLGASAEKLRERIEDVRSIEEIYDLIVKIRAHVSRKTGEADSDKFLEQLITGLAARKPGKK